MCPADIIGSIPILVGVDVTPSYTSGYLLVVLALLGNVPVSFWYLGLREKALAEVYVTNLCSVYS
jgi:hypothetical protein